MLSQRIYDLDGLLLQEGGYFLAEGLSLFGVADYSQSDPPENWGPTLELEIVPLEKRGHHPRVCNATSPAYGVLLGEAPNAGPEPSGPASTGPLGGTQTPLCLGC